MKRKHGVDVPLERISEVVQDGPRKAEANELAAGREVADGEEEKLVGYEPDARPLVNAGYPADDGPLSADDIAAIRKIAEPLLPKGKARRRRTLLGASDD
ncbi:MAG: hypothetical protein M0Z99_19235 [Betaproteobacteria bacterium]|nr:hypothetical protein [Betaproteobacteria bacterium]